jgi:hypothetical protein
VQLDLRELPEMKDRRGQQATQDLRVQLEQLEIQEQQVRQALKERLAQKVPQV